MNVHLVPFFTYFLFLWSLCLRMFLEQGTGFLVDDDRHVAVQLQDAGWCARLMLP